MDNYINGFKPIVGSNDYYNAIISGRATINDKSRAYFPITYNSVKYNVDAETALSLVLQYACYTIFKDPSITYDTFPMNMKLMLENPRNVILSVYFLLCY